VGNVRNRLPLVLQVYLLFSIVVLAFEESDHYVEAAAVTVVAVLVEQYAIVLPGLGRIRVVERWAAGREVDRGRALDATYIWARGMVVRAMGPTRWGPPC
jgi:adenylate cyclase